MADVQVKKWDRLAWLTGMICARDDYKINLLRIRTGYNGYITSDAFETRV